MSHLRTVLALLVLVSSAAPAGEVERLPPDDGSFLRTWHLDPDGGDDRNDGGSPERPLRTLAALSSRRLGAGTRVAIRRGSVLRLTATVQLHGGNAAGWAAYGAYGEPRLPKPILLGSTGIAADAWQAAGPGRWRLDWSERIDCADGRRADGVEQGPGNLWFFAGQGAEAAMTAWGWRRQHALAPAATRGDWHYDPAARAITLAWPGPPPAWSEAAPNRTLLSYKGQSHLIVEDLDLRYAGGYVFAGHETAHLRLRRLDLSFSGGGTKNGAYVRLGNGIEVAGNTRDVVVEGCRLHQIFDTGIDPQNTGPVAVVQRGLTFRGNLISRMGLASFELWARPAGSRLEGVLIEGNTCLGAGRGWGYEQHDHAGQSKVGADLVIFENQAAAADLAVRRNVFAGGRLVLLAEFQERQAATRALVRALELRDNLWDPAPGAPAAMLFQGRVDAAGNPDPGPSPVYSRLADWQRSTLVPGKDAGSIQGDPGFAAPRDALDQDRAWILGLPAASEQRPRRLGPFALAGDYRRPAAGAERPR
ncbi:MAG: hypothetical protein L6R48_13350 [Planctomycetes bacterium]|nr:hypothetical protein [Planctomycetota bacterium]